MAVIVDYSNLYYRNIYANKKSVQESPIICAHLLLVSLYKIVNDFHINAKNPLIIAVDCKRENNWRTAFYAEHSKKFSAYKGKTYKGQRSDDPTIPWNEVREILDDVKNFLKDHTDVLVVEHPKAEADDVIYVIAKKIKQKITIVSPDKDFNQLLGNEHISLYDPINKKFRELDKSPEDTLNYHILIGDSSDNILNCKRGMGKKTAEKSLLDLDNLLEKEDDLRERFNFNKVLIDLSELPDWIEEEILEGLDKHFFKYDLNEVRKFFIKYRLRKLANQVGKLKFH